MALLVWFTVREPPRGLSEVGTPAPASEGAAVAGGGEVPCQLRSFRHMCLAAGLHSVVWYAGSQLNGVFFIRSHGMSSGEAGTWLALFAGVGAVGTLLGGLLADKCATRTGDRRWYMWVPGIATIVMVPFQFMAYLSNDLRLVIPSFCMMISLASMFLRTVVRGVADAGDVAHARGRDAPCCCSFKRFVGLGIGPMVAGWLSDVLSDTIGMEESIRYGLCIVGFVNIWAAFHYFVGAKSIRENIENTERLNRLASQPAS